MNVEKKDHTSLPNKCELRRRLLPKDARVLDLFAGDGKIYEAVYMGKVKMYRGVDKRKRHSLALCDLADNRSFIKRHNLDQYNVFDLDDYGSPWKLFYSILSLIGPGEKTFFITDGLPLKLNLGGKVRSRILWAIERIPRQMNIPGMSRWYVDVFMTMLKTAEAKFKIKVKGAHYFYNPKRSVCYWAIRYVKESE